MTGKLRKGFHREANETAESIRAELGLGNFDPLDPWKLAAHLDIEIRKLSDIAVEEPAVSCLLEEDDKSLSAATVFKGSKRRIVVNDAHGLPRQCSSICHELAHGLLLHTPAIAFNASGCRHWDQEMEDEADCLGGKLLLTDQAARGLVTRNVAADAAQRRYGISPEMLRYRLNMSGAQRLRQSKNRQPTGNR
ncbi:ImmA/IrrE family metallo-endopeptidase [Micromonospora tarensis]|uniref:ImmA/IrrE family metallo-endopeptidase n=1 Tax=Micromonospora tarensis TaxID=2806100 RepID=A0ABS1YEB1_9ACTN|nr:ImmA/IrrE family metallo-endopeptidase [Micromonospora tarensis]MBM0275755.1 ImmA/IrrE family metallo-endopeptidase [Micromonospora tarensis]